MKKTSFLALFMCLLLNPCLSSEENLEDSERAITSLKELKNKKIEARKNKKTDPHDYFYKLTDYIQLACEVELEEIKNEQRFKTLANKLLNMTSKFEDDWNYGNAIHYSHIILGRLSLKAGDIKKSTDHLIKASKTPGSPQLNSFGPNMTLARELLEEGQREKVVSFIKNIQNFWESEYSYSAIRWINEIESTGATDFSKYHSD